MKLRSIQSPRTAGLVAAIAPMAIVAFLALTDTGLNPSSARAGSSAIAALEAAGPVAPAKPTAQQLAARERAEELLSRAFEGSPFRAPAQAVVEAPAQAEKQPIAPETPTFTITSIINSPKGAIAVIAGRPRREGDIIEGGWIIAAIDAGTLEVSVTREGSPTFTIPMRSASQR